MTEAAVADLSRPWLPKSPFTNATVAEARRLRWAGMSLADVARTVGAGYGTVHRWCRDIPVRVVLTEERHPNWRGDAAGKVTKRRRAQRRYPLGPCEECGAPGIDRHHRDGDVGNNEPENIAILCRTCHMRVDGRLERLAAYKTPVKPPQPCVNCGVLAKPRRRGRCERCASYFYAHGCERPPVPGDLRTARKAAA